MEEDLSKELDLQIKGAEKPSIWQLLGVRFILLPYTIGKVRKKMQLNINRTFFFPEVFQRDYEISGLIRFLFSSYCYGRCVGSGDTRLNDLLILGKMLLTSPDDLWGSILIHGPP